MTLLTINIDMDGVVYDFNAAITSYGELYLNRKLPEETTNWEMWDAWGIEKDEWYEIFHLAIQTGELFNQEGMGIDGAVEAIKRLKKDGHRIRIVTSKLLRGPRSTAAAMIQTVRWLEGVKLIDRVELSFAHNKQGYEADVIIDDKPNLEWAQKGKHNLLFTQPWNEGGIDPIKSRYYNIERVRNWHRVLYVVNEASGYAMASRSI